MSSYLQQLADDIKADLDPDLVPRGDTTSLWRIYAVLVRAKGLDVTASDVHDAWTAWALAERPSHGALVPFDELEPSAQAKDEPYVLALRRVARRHRATVGTGGL